MLTVVEDQAVALDRRRQSSEPPSALEEHDVGAGVCGRQGSGDTRQTSPDDRDATRHGVLPARLRAATSPFSQVGRDTRPPVTAIGSRSIRVSKRR